MSPALNDQSRAPVFRDTVDVMRHRSRERYAVDDRVSGESQFTLVLSGRGWPQHASFLVSYGYSGRQWVVIAAGSGYNAALRIASRRHGASSDVQLRQSVPAGVQLRQAHSIH
jgi:hypothetical protein